MLKNVILVLLLNLYLLTFGQKEKTDLKDFFSKSEIQDLNLIADFLQTELCGTADRTKFGYCIKSSLPKLSDWKQTYIQDKISWRKQKKLYSKISDSTFQKIWGLCKTWRTIEPKYEYKSICFSQNENFIQFLKKVGESNPYLEGYGKKLENVGSFDSGNFLVWNIIEHPQNWNLEDRNVQIILAIHFLTQNDQQKRDKKAIRLEKRDIRKMERKQRRKNK
nr:hypothetical protein [uncultured Allomuricauda sp.]